MSTFAIPQIPTPPETDDIKVLREYIQQLANITAMTMKELDWLINGNMDAKNIRANSIEAKLIKADAITADKINVDELSAITANLGTIIAGVIYGAYIATTTGAYPRIEFSSDDNLLKASGSATQNVRLLANSGITPALIFQDGNTMAMFHDGTVFNIIGAPKIAITSSSSDVIIDCATGSNVEVKNLRVNSGVAFDTITQSGSAGATLPQLEAQVNTIIQNLRAMNIYGT